MGKQKLVISGDANCFNLKVGRRYWFDQTSCYHGHQKVGRRYCSFCLWRHLNFQCTCLLPVGARGGGGVSCLTSGVARAWIIPLLLQRLLPFAPWREWQRTTGRSDQQMQGEVAAARCHPRMKRVVGGGMCRDGRNRAGRTEKSEISLALGLEIPLGSGCCMHHHS